MSGWIVYVMGGRTPRGPVRRQTWYAAISDQVAACEQVKAAAILARDESVKTFAQATDAQLEAQGVQPGTVKRLNVPGR